MLKKRIQHTGIRFGKSGMVPTHYRIRVPETLTENRQKEIQQRWEELIDEELAVCPEFAKKALETAKKRKVAYEISYGCKWDLI